ncbi:MAG: regulatory protein RecX [Gammaproteobacteria bacterium]
MRDAGEEAKRAALRLLARREHTRSELAQKLAARGVGSEVAEHVLAELSAGALQSDERFAEEYARARIERGYGPEQILAGLRERGIDQAILLHRVDPRDPAWIERLAEARRRRFGDVLPVDPGQRARQCRFLVRRGFPAALVRRLLGHLSQLEGAGDSGDDDGGENAGCHE